MLNTCVRSLRSKGKFFGDIVVLKNVAEPLVDTTYSDHVREFHVPLEENYGFTEPQLKRAKGKHFKFILHEFVDCTQYDNILYLDIDIIAIRNINSMFCSEGRDLMYAVEDSPMSSDSFNHFFDGDELRQAELKKGANSGTFCIFGKGYRRFVDQWKSNFDLPLINPGYEWDQPALNALILKEQLPSQPYHLKTVYFPMIYSYNYGSETVLYHFNSKGQKEKDFNVMRSYLELIAP